LIRVRGLLDSIEALRFKILPLFGQFRDTFKPFALMDFQAFEITGLFASQGWPLIRSRGKLTLGIETASKTFISANRLIRLFQYGGPVRGVFSLSQKRLPFFYIHWAPQLVF